MGYQITYTDVNGLNWLVLITDTLAGSGQVYSPLIAATNSPVVLKAINNSADKLSAIRAKEVVIQFVNDGTVTLEHFAGTDSPDDRWRVDVLRNTELLFIGTLAMDDLTEPLQDPINVVTLTATDGLGKLKDIPLVDTTGAKPVGVKTLIGWLACALYSTGLKLPIIVIDRTQVGGANAFDIGSLDARTFGTTEMQNSYSAIEKNITRPLLPYPKKRTVVCY
ncbi:hypothetical protein LWM68_40980 [Niabella sp. W65]|nr:hypothetical protein [Niabella sp. W65]MCH7368548.1 hypothetical protein [Niabella sp. W65]ULT44137.1 hypothetical protein KRR40_12675 [Niabella sp. I65]